MNLDRAMARAWAEIDEDALISNYRLAVSLCRRETAVMAVVKGNAYGLGLRRTVETLREAGARWFAAAAPEEALLARRAAPDAQILLLCPAPESYLPLLIRRGIVLTVGSLRDAQAASRAAEAGGAIARAHVKVDTGLHRLGFGEAEEALKIRAVPYISWEGLYSHLALRSDRQSAAQHQRFTALAEALERGGLHLPMRHLLDSIGLTRYPDWQMQGVRVGAFLYGNLPPDWPRFAEGKAVAAFRCRVLRVFPVRAGEAVGYGNAPLQRDCLAATLSAGYMDGYPRSLSGVGQVCVHGQRAPVLGLVCMDQMMIDVTAAPDTRPGDIVTLLGDEISLGEYASWGGLGRNECLGALTPRVPRIYCRQGKPVHIEADMDGGG